MCFAIRCYIALLERAGRFIFFGAIAAYKSYIVILLRRGESALEPERSQGDKPK